MNVLRISRDFAGGMLLEDADAYELARHAGLMRRAARLDGRSLPLRLLQLLEVLERHAESLPLSVATKAATHPASQVAPEASQVAPELATQASHDRESQWLSTRAAAELVGVSPRAVRDAAQRNRVKARRRGRGRGVLEVDVESARRWKRERRS